MSFEERRVISLKEEIKELKWAIDRWKKEEIIWQENVAELKGLLEQIAKCENCDSCGACRIIVNEVLRR